MGVFTPCVHAQSKATIAVVGGQVLDGTGAAPISEGVVLIEGQRITAVGSAAAVPIPAGARIIRADGMTVMPGLIDMHVHLALIGSADAGCFVQPHLDREEREVMPAGARRYLMNGITTIRDTGAPIEIVNVRDRVNRGEIPGARLFVAGPMQDRKLEKSEIGWDWEVPDVATARAKVHELVKAGVDWIKIHETERFSEEEIAAIAEEAHRADKPFSRTRLSKRR